MKRALLFAALLLCAPVYAASIVQCVGADNDGAGGGLTINGTNGWVASTVGDAIVIMTEAVVVASAPTDSASQTYTAAPVAGTYMASWYKLNSASITSITLGVGGKISVIACEISGLNAYDNSVGNYQQAATTTPSSGAITVTSGDFAIGLGGYNNGSGIGWTAGSGWSAVTGTGITSGVHADSGNSEIFVETQTTTTSANATMTTVGSAVYDAAIVAFKVSGGASCTNEGYEPAGGVLAIPNGTSGSFLSCAGAIVTPNCSSVTYYQPAGGKCEVN